MKLSSILSAAILSVTAFILIPNDWVRKSVGKHLGTIVNTFTSKEIIEDNLVLINTEESPGKHVCIFRTKNHTGANFFANKDSFRDRNQADIAKRLLIAGRLLNPLLGHLAEERFRALDNINGTPWRMNLSHANPSLRASDEDFFKALRRHRSIRTLVLRAPLGRVLQLTGSDLYPWSGNDCSLIENTFWDQNTDNGRHLHQHKCHSVLNNTLRSENITAGFLNDVYRELKTDFKGLDKQLLPSEPDVFVTHVHVATHGVVSPIGNVLFNGVQLQPKGCPNQYLDTSTDIDLSHLFQYKLYKEVFVISQVWNGYFHVVIEQFTRLIPYLCFLKIHSSIVIHMDIRSDMFDVVKEYLVLFGIDTSRLVTGVVRAEVVYMPGGSDCGNPPLFHARLLSLWLRYNIQNPPDRRTSVVLIHRKKGWRRWLNYHEEIKKKLHMLTRINMKLVMEELTDPVPALEQVARMFNRATVIVAPHGAGLSNMLFSEPGTVVIEALCRVSQTGLCFRNLAYLLGHRYYGVLERKSCLNITANNLLHPVLFYINLTGKHKDRKNIIPHEPVKWANLGQ